MATDPSKSKNLYFPAITGISFIMIILILLIFFPCPTSSQYIFFRIIISIAVAGFASVLPGFFQFQHQKVITAGGALGVFAFIYLFNPALIDTSDKCGTFDFTVFIENSEGRFDYNGKATFYLRIENDKRPGELDSKGEVTFKGIPVHLRRDSLSIEIQAPGWEFENGKYYTKVALIEKSTVLKIRRDNSLCCISGSVRDGTSHFLQDVKIGVGNIFTRSDQNGRFNIEIPPGQQKERQTLTAFKDGYDIWQDDVYPSTRQEVQILLRK